MESTFKASLGNLVHFKGLYVLYAVSMTALTLGAYYFGSGPLEILGEIISLMISLCILGRIDERVGAGFLTLDNKRGFTVLATYGILVILTLLLSAVGVLLVSMGLTAVVFILGLIAVIPMVMVSWGLYLLPVFILDTGVGYFKGCVACYRYVDGHKADIFWEVTKLSLFLSILPLVVIFVLMSQGLVNLGGVEPSATVAQGVAGAFVAPFLTSNSYELYKRIKEKKAVPAVEVEPVADGREDDVL